MRSLGMRRRTLLAGRAEALGRALRGALARRSAAPSPRCSAPSRTRRCSSQDLEQLGEMADLPALVRELRPDDLVLAGAELPDSALLELADACRSTRTRLRFVPTTAELLLQRASFVPGQVVPLLELRPPVLTGLEWAVKRTFDIVVATFVLVLLSPLLAGDRADRARWQPGPDHLPRPAHRRRRGRVRDAQVPLDVRGRARPAGRPRGAERGRRRDLQDARRPARDADRARASADSRSTSCRSS